MAEIPAARGQRAAAPVEMLLPQRRALAAEAKAYVVAAMARPAPREPRGGDPRAMHRMDRRRHALLKEWRESEGTQPGAEILSGR